MFIAVINKIYNNNLVVIKNLVYFATKVTLKFILMKNLKKKFKLLGLFAFITLTALTFSSFKVGEHLSKQSDQASMIVSYDDYSTVLFSKCGDGKTDDNKLKKEKKSENKCGDAKSKDCKKAKKCGSGKCSDTKTKDCKKDKKCGKGKCDYDKSKKSKKCDNGKSCDKKTKKDKKAKAEKKCGAAKCGK